jgi:hypothetical protein
MIFIVVRHGDGVTGSFNHMRLICSFSELEKSYFTGKARRMGDFQSFMWTKEPVFVVVLA